MASAINTSVVAGQKRTPLLANGDCLTRAEFERLYATMPEGIKAELIEGVVYRAPPVRYQWHGKHHGILMGWLTYYVAKTPGLLDVGDNSTVRLDKDNEPQPDALLMLPSHVGGKTLVDSDGYIVGPPALVCEIAGSSANIDLHGKKDVYRRGGVQEYLVWRTEDAAVDWFALVEGRYIPIAPEADGALCSKIFPGLCLHPMSLLAGDLRALFALIDHAATTPEHAKFVAMLTPAISKE